MGLFIELKIEEIRQKLEAINTEAEKKHIIKELLELLDLLLERQEEQKVKEVLELFLTLYTRK